MRKIAAIGVMLMMAGCGGESIPVTSASKDVRAELLKAAAHQNEVASQQLARAVTACRDKDMNQLRDIASVTRSELDIWNKGPGNDQQRDRFGACADMLAAVGTYANTCASEGKPGETTTEVKWRNEDTQACIELQKNPPPLP